MCVAYRIGGSFAIPAVALLNGAEPMKQHGLVPPCDAMEQKLKMFPSKIFRVTEHGKPVSIWRARCHKE